MLARRFISFFRSSPASSSVKSANEGKSGSVRRKAVSFVLITATGGVALSALDDLAIYHGCSSKAMEKVIENQAIIEAIGEPIRKGPWYNASLAVAHKRHSVSCSFPVSGPQGNGILQLKAVRNGDNSWYSFFHPRDWEILIMDALVHVPSNEGTPKTTRINVAGNLSSPACEACVDCKPSEPENTTK